MKLQVLESTHHQLGKKHIVPINDTGNSLGYTLLQFPYLPKL